MTDSEKLDLVIAEMQGVKSGLERVENRVGSLENRVGSLDNRVGSVESEMKGVKSGLERVENRVRSIEITLENVTIPNIKTIAEGHVALERKLDEVIQTSAEQEEETVRLGFVENDVRILKERMAQAAI